MPHELTQPGDICFAESIVDGHLGNVWLYLYLPGDDRVTAIRLCQLPQVGIGPKLYRWNERIDSPTIVGIITEGNKPFRLTAGVLEPA